MGAAASSEAALRNALATAIHPPKDVQRYFRPLLAFSPSAADVQPRFSSLLSHALLASPGSLPHDPRRWKISHVSVWLRQNELNALVEPFRENCIDGQVRRGPVLAVPAECLGKCSCTVSRTPPPSCAGADRRL